MIGVVILVVVLGTALVYGFRRHEDLKVLNPYLTTCQTGWAADRVALDGYRESARMDYETIHWLEQRRDALELDRDGAVALLQEFRALAAQELERAKATALTYFRAWKAGQKDLEQARNSSKRSLDQLSRKVQTLGRVIEERDVLLVRADHLAYSLGEQDRMYAEALASQEQATIQYAQEAEQAQAILRGALPLPNRLDTPTDLVPLAQAVQDHARELRGLALERSKTILHLDRVMRGVMAQRDQALAQAPALPQEQGQ